jgi:hypothetical protein
MLFPPSRFRFVRPGCFHEFISFWARAPGPAPKANPKWVISILGSSYLGRSVPE